MPSPVTAADFDLTNFSGDVCQEITQLLGLAGKLKVFFEWAFDADGNPSQAFKDAMAIIPVGAIMWRSVDNLPAGWLICNGQGVSRTAYANLFAILGTSHGVGDGSTTFNLPNLMGRVPLGAGAGYAVGQYGGSHLYSLTLTASNLPPHQHKIGLQSGTDGYVGLGETDYFLLASDGVNVKLVPGDGGRFGYTEIAGGGGSAIEIPTVPPYLAGHWIIKY